MWLFLAAQRLVVSLFEPRGHMVGRIRLIYMDGPVAGARPMLRVEMVVSSQLWVPGVFQLHSLKHTWSGCAVKPTHHIHTYPHLGQWPELGGQLRSQVPCNSWGELCLSVPSLSCQPPPQVWSPLLPASLTHLASCPRLPCTYWAIRRGTHCWCLVMKSSRCRLHEGLLEWM